MALRRVKGIEKVREFHSILANCGKYFSQPFTKHGNSEVSQREMPSPMTLVIDPSVSEFELVI